MLMAASSVATRAIVRIDRVDAFVTTVALDFLDRSGRLACCVTNGFNAGSDVELSRRFCLGIALVAVLTTKNLLTAG